MALAKWDERELPILRAVIELLDDEADVTLAAIATATGLDGKVVSAGLRALASAEPAMVDMAATQTANGAWHIWQVNSVSGEARRAVGTWPTPESRAAEIIAALEAVADRTADPEQKGRLRKVAGWLGTTGRDVLVEITGTAISKGMGLS